MYAPALQHALPPVPLVSPRPTTTAVSRQSATTSSCVRSAAAAAQAGARERAGGRAARRPQGLPPSRTPFLLYAPALQHAMPPVLPPSCMICMISGGYSGVHVTV